jgi:cation:H+ antiporter
MNPWLALILGLVVLYFGAQALVKGGAGLALRLGLTPLVIGLTVMAFGTSSPELVVSLQAAATGNGAIAVGNVIGSNICNIALIIGLCSLVTPIGASTQMIRREVPVMIGASVITSLFLLDGHLARWEGALLFIGLIIYTTLTVRKARSETAARGAQRPAGEPEIPQLALGTSIALVVLGLGGLLVGAHFFVEGAVTLAQSWGMSEVAIGLTVVAFGTSLPELATSLVAAIRKDGDVALGNVVGSSIFNLLGILGITALIHPIDVPELALSDLGVMLAVSIALLPLAKSGGRVNRWEGALFLATYAGYTAWLLMHTAA